MKNSALKLAGVFAFSLFSISTFAQLNWQKNGNNANPPGSQPILGTDASWNAPLIIQTFGVERLLINNGGTGNNAGRLAVGNNLPGGFNPASRIHSHQDGGQNRIEFTSNTTGITGTDGFQVGINNNGHAMILQRENRTIRFFTNSTERMRIYNGSFAQPGMVRLGFGTTANPNGFGAVIQTPELLVVGATAVAGDVNVAEFRSTQSRSRSVGINIRGARNAFTTVCTAHMDLSNYDDNNDGGNPSPGEFVMARVAADMQTSTGFNGYYSVFTNEGTPGNSWNCNS